MVSRVAQRALAAAEERGGEGEQHEARRFGQERQGARVERIAERQVTPGVLVGRLPLEAVKSELVDAGGRRRHDGTELKSARDAFPDQEGILRGGRAVEGRQQGAGRATRYGAVAPDRVTRRRAETQVLVQRRQIEGDLERSE